MLTRQVATGPRKQTVHRIADIVPDGVEYPGHAGVLGRIEVAIGNRIKRGVVIRQGGAEKAAWVAAHETIGEIGSARSEVRKVLRVGRDLVNRASFSAGRVYISKRGVRPAENASQRWLRDLPRPRGALLLVLGRACSVLGILRQLIQRLLHILSKRLILLLRNIRSLVRVRCRVRIRTRFAAHYSNLSRTTALPIEPTAA